MPEPQFLEPNDTFVPRHIGPTESEIQTMLETLNVPSLESLVEATVPSDIRLQGTLAVPSPAASRRSWRSCAAWPDRIRCGGP